MIKNLSIIITDKCNLSCRYCYLKKERYPKSLSERKLFKGLDIFFSFSPLDKCVQFTGGEPLLSFPLLKKAVEYIRGRERKEKRIIDIGVISNGTLLNGRILDFFKEQRVGLIISLDGGKTKTDSNRIFSSSEKSVFDTVLKNLKG
jgi:uncharacterized protein